VSGPSLDEAAAADPHAPVLVVHGAAVRNRTAFEQEVARLADAVGGDRRFVPVFWGDLGQPAESIEEVLPYLDWASPDTAALIEADPPDPDDAVPGADAQPSRRARLGRVVSSRELERLAERIGTNWRRQSETARRRLISAFYRAVRDQYLAAAAHFAGDIILYQRRQIEIQARVWETVMREVPGYGLPEHPVHVLTHSLGGSVAFDLAVGGHPPLHIDHLITCACTAPYFHVLGCSPSSLAPHRPGTPVTLPPTVQSWTNFFIPLDPWGYLAAPAFRLNDGSIPVDVEVHAGDRGDRILRHGAAHYWNHPIVVAGVGAALGVTPEPDSH
jgi:hypothetical protein